MGGVRRRITSLAAPACPAPGSCGSLWPHTKTTRNTNVTNVENRVCFRVPSSWAPRLISAPAATAATPVTAQRNRLSASGKGRPRASPSMKEALHRFTLQRGVRPLILPFRTLLTWTKTTAYSTPGCRTPGKLLDMRMLSPIGGDALGPSPGVSFPRCPRHVTEQPRAAMPCQLLLASSPLPAGR